VGFWFLVSGFWFVVFWFLVSDWLLAYEPETTNQQPETTPRATFASNATALYNHPPLREQPHKDLQRFYEQKGNRVGALRLNPWSDTLFIFAVHSLFEQPLKADRLNWRLTPLTSIKMGSSFCSADYACKATSGCPSQPET